MPRTEARLAEIAATDDFRVAPFRTDGETPGTPTFIWPVVTVGALYIGAHSGTRSSWYGARPSTSGPDRSALRGAPGT